MNATQGVGLRDPDTVMRLDRLGAFHQCRLSFMRVLLRRLRDEGWDFERTRFDIAADGTGTAVYTARGAERSYSLIAFAHDIPDDQRSDRVIATMWDATFCLFDGVPDAADIERLRGNVPRQEAGRLSARELSLSRANRSERLWAHVVDRLAAGRQPDEALLRGTGYLMRTTAVYGSGKFGAACRDAICDRPELANSFQVEMLTVYLIRTFVADLAEAMAAHKGGDGAVRLEPRLRRLLGIGNSTGLGMAPFLVNHPALLHTWIAARETALMRVRAAGFADAAALAGLRGVLEAARQDVAEWHSAHPYQQAKLAALTRDLEVLSRHLGTIFWSGGLHWDALYRWGEEELSLEGQEMLVSLMLEPNGALVDDLGTRMWVREEDSFRIDGSGTTGALCRQIEAQYAWALTCDFEAAEAQARFWYVSQNKLEPRLGERAEEPGCELEQPLAIARDVKALWQALEEVDDATRLARFLLDHPHHRHAARRVQICARRPYSEIRDNLIGAGVMPIDMLRCKLSFFGATKFDPRSDRWVRICMFQNAPYPEDLARGSDYWVYPALDQAL